MDADKTRETVHETEGRVQELLFEILANRLCTPRGVAGLSWSPRMPDDDPNADLLVVFTDDGPDYVLEIDVTLWRQHPTTTERPLPG